MLPPVSRFRFQNSYTTEEPVYRRPSTLKPVYMSRNGCETSDQRSVLPCPSEETELKLRVET